MLKFNLSEKTVALLAYGPNQTFSFSQILGKCVVFLCESYLNYLGKQYKICISHMIYTG